MNEDGNYSCSCNPGYQLANDGWGCTDIDECAVNMGNCSHNCTNTIGSYNCSCDSGYRIANNNHECDGKAYLIKSLIIWPLSLYPGARGEEKAPDYNARG